MSISFKLDKNNNLLYGDNLIMADGKVSLVQDIKTSLSMTKGEYPYNRDMGIDYLSYLRTGDKQALLSDIIDRVLSDRRVNTCDAESGPDGKKLLIILNTTSGEVEIEL